MLHKRYVQTKLMYACILEFLSTICNRWWQVAQLHRRNLVSNTQTNINDSNNSNRSIDENSKLQRRR